MKILYNINQYTEICQSSIALGTFDGIHLGHQDVLNRAIEFARDKSIKSICLTFKNNPINTIKNLKSDSQGFVKSIQSFEDRAEALENIGFDYLICLDSDQSFMDISKESFIEDYLVHKLNAIFICCGFNYSFGKGAFGNTTTLKELSAQYGYDVFIAKPHILDGEIISSSLIRNYLQDKNIQKVNAMLGRKFSISGSVVKGEQNGHKFGYPTYNLSLDSGLVYPGTGVYDTLTYIGGKSFPSITNVGYKGTIGDFPLGVETYINNFNQDIYGLKPRLEFCEFRRDEIKFNTIEELINQIKIDVNSRFS